MKSTDQNERRQALLEELLAGNDATTALGIEEVLSAIVAAKKARTGRRRMAVGAMALMMIGSAALIWPDRSRRAEELMANATTPAATPVGEDANPIPIERVDDEGLLELLADTPSALVRLPDGRTELFVVMRSRATQ